MSDNGLIDPSPRNLGGLRIGALGYGCWRLVAMSTLEARARIEQALTAGMNLIDTADVYGLDWGGTAFGAAEALLGEVLADAPGLRDQMVLASKGGIVPGVPYNSARLEAACDESLRRLKVERLDLYQVHRPDLLTHPEETARALEKLQRSGKIGEVGVSNYSIHQTEALMHFLPGGIASQQPQYSALHLDPLFDGTFDQCLRCGHTVLAWSPLAGGRLGGSGPLPDELREVLAGLAEREGVSPATIALAFVLAHPSRPVALIGSTDLARIADATRALTVQLSRTDAYAIIQASMGQALP